MPKAAVVSESDEPPSGSSVYSSSTKERGLAEFADSTMPEVGTQVDIVQAKEVVDFEVASQLFSSFLEVHPNGRKLHEADDAHALQQLYSAEYASIFLAYIDGVVAGCCAVYPQHDTIHQQACELHRLFVLPSFRGMGVGHQLCEVAIEFAELVPYHGVLLDTLNNREAQRSFYEEFGFYEVPPFHDMAVDADGRFLKLDLEWF